MNNWNEENGKYKRYGIDAKEKSQKKLSRRVSKKFGREIARKGTAYIKLRTPGKDNETGKNLWKTKGGKTVEKNEQNGADREWNVAEMSREKRGGKARQRGEKNGENQSCGCQWTHIHTSFVPGCVSFLPYISTRVSTYFHVNIFHTRYIYTHTYI